MHILSTTEGRDEREAVRGRPLQAKSRHLREQCLTLTLVHAQISKWFIVALINIDFRVCGAKQTTTSTCGYAYGFQGPHPDKRGASSPIKTVDTLGEGI